MAELPLDQGIPRFKTNEDRFHDFVNGSTGDSYETDGGVAVPSVRKFLNDKSGEINEAANGILALTTAQADRAAESEDAAAESARQAAESAEAVGLFDPANYYTKTVIDTNFYSKSQADARYYTQTYLNSALGAITSDVTNLQTKTTTLTSLISGLRSNVSSMALVVADLDGRRLGMANSVADAFDDLSGVVLQSGGNDVNTITLLHFDGANNSTTITDSCASPRRFIPVGDTKIVTNQSKFGGSSVYLDGAGDYLQGDGNPAFNLLTSDFTIDFWIRFGSVATTSYIYDGRSAASNDGLLIVLSAGKINMNNAAGSTVITSTTTVVVNTWYHVALVRSSGVDRLYINGVQEGVTYADSYAYTNNANAPKIGIARDGAAGPMTGWIDELRVSNVARWTGNFTPPTAQYANDPAQSQNVIYSEANDWFTATTELSNTLALIHGDGANGSTALVDSTGLRNWVAVGNAQLSTAQSKFGGSSMLFDGSGDAFRQVPVSPYRDLTLLTGDYTIECWVRPTNTTPTNVIWDARSSSVTSNPIVYINNAAANVIVNIGATVRITGTTALAINTWYHVALVRSSGVTRLYINGVQEGVSYTDPNIWADQSAGFTIGANYDNSSSFNGYIDEFRISGTGRWTGPFTPPTVPYDLPKSNMVITSVTYTAASAPTTGRMVVQTIETDTITINTDLIAEVSRDGGTTYTAVALSLASDLGGVKVCEGMADISAQPSGTAMKWRVRTANNKNVTVSGAVLQWS